METYTYTNVLSDEEISILTVNGLTITYTKTYRGIDNFVCRLHLHLHETIDTAMYTYEFYNTHEKLEKYKEELLEYLNGTSECIVNEGSKERFKYLQDNIDAIAERKIRRVKQITYSTL